MFRKFLATGSRNLQTAEVRTHTKISISRNYHTLYNLNLLVKTSKLNTEQKISKTEFLKINQRKKYFESMRYFLTPGSDEPMDKASVRLKIGKKYDAKLIEKMLLNIESLYKKNLAALFDLSLGCKIVGHRMDGKTIEIAKNYNFMDTDNQIYPLVKDIILSMTELQSVKIKFVNPILPQPLKDQPTPTCKR